MNIPAHLIPLAVTTTPEGSQPVNMMACTEETALLLKSLSLHGQRLPVDGLIQVIHQQPPNIKVRTIVALSTRSDRKTKNPMRCILHLPPIELEHPSQHIHNLVTHRTTIPRHLVTMHRPPLKQHLLIQHPFAHHKVVVAISSQNERRC